ncbi:MAG: hypothetical protein U0572_11205 [Phycisphaerales bacterium]
MKINHRIALRHDDRFWREIDRLGLHYDRGDPNNVLQLAISVLNVTEDQPEWPEVERLVAKYCSGPHSVSTLFTKAELDTARWLQLSALGHHGYPQPEEDFGYQEVTYDLTEYCPTCGIGGAQKAPFRLRAEFKPSRSQILQLNWVFDEFFLRDEAREGLRSAAITGIDYLAPVLHKSGRQSERVAQMVVKTKLPLAINPVGLQPVTCKPQNEEWQEMQRLRISEPEKLSHCGRVKYHRAHKGPYRFDGGAFAGAPDVVKSHEWFGSGASAHRLVIVSQRFRQAVVTSKWRGVSFEPIELVE